MPVTVNDLIQTAREFSDCDSEVILRTAASKAMYAAYHSLQDIHRHLNRGVEVRGGAHQILIERLVGFHDKKSDKIAAKVRALGNMYKQLRDIRTDADYKLEQSFPKDKALMAVITAEKLLEKVSELEASGFPPPSSPSK